MTTDVRPGATSRNLSGFLCFAVYSANLAFGRLYRPVLEKLGFSYTQYVAMGALLEEDDLGVGGLGERLPSSTRSVSTGHSDSTSTPITLDLAFASGRRPRRSSTSVTSTASPSARPSGVSTRSMGSP